jgi:hypothetical protein
MQRFILRDLHIEGAGYKRTITRPRLGTVIHQMRSAYIQYNVCATRDYLQPRTLCFLGKKHRCREILFALIVPERAVVPGNRASGRPYGVRRKP